MSLGGLGIVDLGYIAGFVPTGRDQTVVPVAVYQVQVTAAVLVFQALTYGLLVSAWGTGLLHLTAPEEVAEGVSARTPRDRCSRARGVGISV